MLMKKNLRFLFVALMAMVCGSIHAEDTFTFEKGAFSAEQLTATINGVNWTLSATWASEAAFNYDSSNGRGLQIGTASKPATAFTISTSDITKKIQKIIVNCAGASQIAGTVNVTVGGTAIGSEYTLTTTATDAVFEASAAVSGEIKISYAQTSAKAMYINYIKVLYEGETETPVEIQEITVAQALEYCNALEDGKTSTEEYRVKGFVVGTPDIQKKADGTFYGNANFYFADEKGGATTIYAFRIKGLNNENIESETYIQDGDELTVQCKLQKYVKNDVVTPELVQGYIYAKGNGSETSGQVWDFTVLPTQKIDGTGNLATNAADGVLVEDEGAAWAIIYNVAGIEDGTEFTASNGVTFEPTKGLKWSALPNDKMVIYRNYPANYGGKYLFTNKACEVMIPAKAGQVIEIIAGTAKNNKKITSQDVEETFTTDDGETLKGVVVDGTVNYDYKPYTLTVKVANPYISFENNICIQKITVKDAGTSSVKTIQNVTRQNGVRYNLSGQKVGDDYKGIVIMNGKKYMVK